MFFHPLSDEEVVRPPALDEVPTAVEDINQQQCTMKYHPLNMLHLQQ